MKPRCRGCSLTPETCLCATFPRVRSSVRFAIVQHAREAPKPTNTARLFERMVEGVTIVPYGMREPAFDPGPIADDAIDWSVLFPREGAPELDVAASNGQLASRPRGIVLLDGTWHQCSRMSRRAPLVRDLPCVALPPGPPSFWTVRTQHDPRGMSTFEAALRVLSLVDGEAIAVPVREAFARVTATLLHIKGKLSSPDVPAEWGT
jgi:DTW domain-containing protein YfiP